MVNLRSLLVKLKYYWNNLHRSLQPYLNCDYERCLDLIIIGGGIHPVAGPERWKRNCLILYRLLGFYQFIISIAKVGFAIQKYSDFFEICTSFIILTFLVKGAVNVTILEHYSEDVRRTQIYLRSKIALSDDPEFDVSIRQAAVKTAGKVTMAIFVLCCVDQVVILIPSSPRDHLLGIPNQFHVLGTVAAYFLQEAFLFGSALFWGCRCCYASLTIIPVLMGLRNELRIVALGYDTIEDRVQAQVLNEQSNVAGTSRKLANDELKWKNFVKLLEATLEQHAEILRNIQLLEPIVSLVYATIYYSTMLLVSILVFLIIRGEVSVMTMVLVLSTGFLFIECYSWCYLIDSIEDTMDAIAGSVAHLGFRLEHSSVGHSRYIQMRTSLMIIQLNASQSGWFSCGGIFPITTESFADLCFIIYRFATFLLEFD